MRDHCREEHGWASSARRGRPRRNAATQEGASESEHLPWRTGVSHQRFFSQGPGSSFFEVDRQPAGAEGSPGHRLDGACMSPTREAGYMQLIEDADRVLLHAQAEEKKRVQAIDEAKEPSPWQRRAGVARYLASNTHLDLGDMRHLTRPLGALSVEGCKPSSDAGGSRMGGVGGDGDEDCDGGGGGDDDDDDDDEDEDDGDSSDGEEGEEASPDPAVAARERLTESLIGLVQEAFRKLIWTARKHAILETVGIFALFEVERRESGQEAQRPFNPRIRRTTIRRYRHFWNGLLAYLFRTWELPPDRKPTYVLTSRQRQCFEDVTSIAMELHGHQCVSSPQLGHPTEAGAPESQIACQERLRLGVLDLVMALLDQPLKDDAYDSPLASGLAVLSIEDDGRYGELEGFLPRISAIAKFSRLLVVEKARRTRVGEVERLQEEDGLELADAKSKARGHAELVQGMVQRFLVRLPLREEPAPPFVMSWLIRLRTYGMHITYQTPVEGRVHWVGDVVHYESMRLSMDQLRQLVHAVVADARRILFRDLLLAGGLLAEGEEGVDEAPIPRIDWGWVDNPTEKAAGWSFLKDIRNRFEVEGEQWLIRRILHNGRLRSRFTQLRANVPRWTKRAIDQYERHAERFLEKLLINNASRVR
ncbi:hypothetical protein BHE90_017338, partial [Fusarium euwallaceae]